MAVAVCQAKRVGACDVTLIFCALFYTVLLESEMEQWLRVFKMERNNRDKQTNKHQHQTAAYMKDTY